MVGMVGTIRENLLQREAAASWFSCKKVNKKAASAGFMITLLLYAPFSMISQDARVNMPEAQTVLAVARLRAASSFAAVPEFAATAFAAPELAAHELAAVNMSEEQDTLANVDVSELASMLAAMNTSEAQTVALPKFAAPAFEAPALAAPELAAVNMSEEQALLAKVNMSEAQAAPVLAAVNKPGAQAASEHAPPLQAVVDLSGVFPGYQYNGHDLVVITNRQDFNACADICCDLIWISADEAQPEFPGVGADCWTMNQRTKDCFCAQASQCQSITQDAEFVYGIC